MFNFKKERLVKDSIGQGSFGEVFPYQKNSEDFKWVVKRTKAKKIEDLLRCLPEIVLGFSCDHPCIVPVKGYSIESKDNKYNVYMKLPRMAGGNLADELKRRNKKDLYFTENELVKHFYTLVSAVDYLHSKKISYGDIKINNILLDDKGNLKLCDIGSGKFVSDDDHSHTMTSANGAINYKAPEIIQHERALKDYKLNSKSEKKDQPMENILKREHLHLADSWSLGLTMLEICMLEPRLINPYDSVHLIEERFEKIRSGANTRYSGILLDLIFSLLKTDPAQRLKVSAIKTSLEENFKEILTQDFKESLGLQKPSRQEALDISNYQRIFKEKADEIMKSFEDDKKAEENRLEKFEETLDKLQKKLCAFNLEVEKIKAEKNKKVDEISIKYEADIQILKQENRALIEKLGKESDHKLQIEKQEVVPKKPRDEEAYRKKLEKVSTELTHKWREWFVIKSQPCLRITIKYGKSQDLDDKILKEITKDIIDNCCKEALWEEMDEFEMDFGSYSENNKITDETLKVFASQLGQRLSNLNSLVLKMDWLFKITDDGLKEIATQIIPQLTNVKHLELHMYGWNQVTDQGLEVFVSQLAPKVTNLEHFALNLANWNQISDHGLTVLASKLGPNLRNVEHFELLIHYWENITDVGLKAFASQLLPHLANVHHLELSFVGCFKITDEGFKALASQFGPKLANIKTLKLNFDLLEKITSQGLNSLADQIITNLQNLQDLNMDIPCSPLVKKSDVQNLKDKFKKIPNVYIL